VRASKARRAKGDWGAECRAISVVTFYCGK
jgi:hypothetical protein